MNTIFYISSLIGNNYPSIPIFSMVREKIKNFPIHTPPVGIKHYANTVIQ